MAVVLVRERLSNLLEVIHLPCSQYVLTKCALYDPFEHGSKKPAEVLSA